MSNLYRGPSIDASYQVSVHMAEGFQRRRLKCEKLTDDKRRTPSDGKKLTLHFVRWANKTLKVKLNGQWTEFCSLGQVSDCCIMPTQQFFSYIMVEE